MTLCLYTLRATSYELAITVVTRQRCRDFGNSDADTTHSKLFRNSPHAITQRYEYNTTHEIVHFLPAHFPIAGIKKSLKTELETYSHNLQIDLHQPLSENLGLL